MGRLILLAALLFAGSAGAEVPESTADRIRQDEERLFLFHFPDNREEPDAALVDSMFGKPRVVVEQPRYSPVANEPLLTVKSGNLSLESAVTSIATAVGYTAMYLNDGYKVRVGYVPKVTNTPMGNVLALIEDIYGVRIYVFAESRLLMVGTDGPRT